MILEIQFTNNATIILNSALWKEYHRDIVNETTGDASLASKKNGNQSLNEFFNLCLNRAF
jgi:hypothetical protein